MVVVVVVVMVLVVLVLVVAMMVMMMIMIIVMIIIIMLIEVGRATRWPATCGLQRGPRPACDCAQPTACAR